jgi:chaperonin GroEL (HSP60 family)
MIVTIGIEPADLDPGVKEETDNIDSIVTQLKDSVDKFKIENNRLKRELEGVKDDLQAERLIFQSKIKPESYTQPNYEKQKRELEYLIKVYSLKIDNQKDYLREVLNENNDKGNIFR